MSADYKQMALKLGLPAEPPLYTIGNPAYLAQRMEKRLLKPRKEYFDDHIAQVPY